MPYRTLNPNQACQVWIHDTVSAQNTLLFETRELLLEAPNWAPSGDALIVNGNGTLWSLPLSSPALTQIKIAGVPPLNNDHCIAPDGKTIFLSAYDDWQLYRAPLAGGRAEKITGKKDTGAMRHFLHGVSPDGKRLTFVGIVMVPDANPPRIQTAEIFTIAADGTDYRQITSAGVPADGPEYTPDGQWIYFNTEAFSGHAQIARMRTDGSYTERLTNSATVDWFPHASPVGKQFVYLAYPPGTQGHPADLDVSLMLVRNGNWSSPQPAAKLFGGQGTINVNSWSPDSTRFAYVAYPVG
jgi:TolB protein